MARKDALATFFNTSSRKPWVKRLAGSALSLPRAYRQYVLKGELYIEYLSTTSNNGGQDSTQNKNHVVFQIPFAEGYKLSRDEGNNFTIQGARVSMDITEENDLLEDIDEDHVSSSFAFSISFADLAMLAPCSLRTNTSARSSVLTTTLERFI